MKHLWFFRSFVWLSAIVLGMAWNTQAKATKKPSPPQTSFSLGGELLPVSGQGNWAGEPRNQDWQGIARMLRVRDLRVQQWPSAYNAVGAAERQKQLTLTSLQAAGYKIQKVSWKWGVVSNYPLSEGFCASRGKNVLAGLWRNNGSFLFLYWGRQVPLNQEQKRNDDLILAAIAGEENTVEKLLKEGANPFTTDYAGQSVLELATIAHHAPIVRQLLAAHTVRLSAVDTSTALNLAAGTDDVETVKAFLDTNVNIEQIDQALLSTACYGATKAAELLAPHASSAGVDAALVQAAFVEEWRGSAIQHPDIVKLLLAYKPSQQALDTALIAAAYDDEARLVPVLLAAGADIETRNYEGDTILLRAAKDGTAYELSLSQILETGADPHKRDKYGNTTLMWAAATGNPSEVALLLARDVDPNAHNHNGQTALNWVQLRVAKLNWNSPESKRYRTIAQLLREAISRRSKAQ